MQRYLAVAAGVALAAAVPMQTPTISGPVPTTVFALPVVYATVPGQAPVTAVSSGTSDPLATAVFSNAAAVSSAVQAVSKRDVATTCIAQPTGISHTSSPDTAAVFLADTYYSAQAIAAQAPSGYVQTFSSLTASNSADNYMGYTLLDSYNTTQCSALCSAKSGCQSFNIYFERDPTLNPDSANCLNPSSTTNVKCVFWGSIVTAANANNFGQTRGNFTVVIAGSNGYAGSAYVNGVYINDAYVKGASSTTSSSSTTASSPTTSAASTTVSCPAAYATNGGGIQVASASRNSWIKISNPSSSSSPATLVAGSRSATINGTSLYIDPAGTNWRVVESNGAGCNNAMSVNPNLGSTPQQTQWVSQSTTGVAFPGCYVQTWSDWMVICSTVSNGVTTHWNAFTCASDNYQNLWWNTGDIPSGCSWAGLYYYPAYNHNAPF